MTIKLTRRGLIGAGIAASTLPFVGLPAIAQVWPSRSIRFVVSNPPGGFTDLMARAYGDHVSKQLGQPVVVENKGGGGGAVAALDVKRAEPDGHTLLFTTSTTIITNKALYKNLPYDPDRDFARIAYMPTGGVPLVVAKETGASNLNEFAEYARKNHTNVGTYAPGSYAHIAIAELNKQFGLKAEPVHYRGEALMFNGLLTGDVQAAIGTLSSAQSVIDTGKAKVIAVSMAKRMRKLPDVPTFLEQGVKAKAFRLTAFICAVAPAGVPDRIVNRYSDLLVEAGMSERVQQLMATFGIDDAAVGREGFQKLYSEEAPVWLELVSSLGLTQE